MYKQEALDSLECFRSNTAHILGDNDEKVKTIETCMMLVREAEEAERWIPVSEGLPEVYKTESPVGIYMKSNPVLVFGTPEHEEDAQFCIVTYCDDLDGNVYWSTELDAVNIENVIAWMPLPEPYKEDKR